MRNQGNDSPEGDGLAQTARVLKAQPYDRLETVVEFLAQLPSKNAAGLLLELYRGDPKRGLIAVANLFRTEQTSFIPVLWQEFGRTKDARTGWAILNSIANLEVFRYFKGSARNMAKILTDSGEVFDLRLRAAQYLVGRYRSTGKKSARLRHLISNLNAEAPGVDEQTAVAELFEELDLGPMDSPLK